MHQNREIPNCAKGRDRATTCSRHVSIHRLKLKYVNALWLGHTLRTSTDKEPTKEAEEGGQGTAGDGQWRGRDICKTERDRETSLRTYGAG